MFHRRYLHHRRHHLRGVGRKSILRLDEPINDKSRIRKPFLSSVLPIIPTNIQVNMAMKMSVARLSRWVVVPLRQCCRAMSTERANEVFATTSRSAARWCELRKKQITRSVRKMAVSDRPPNMHYKSINSTSGKPTDPPYTLTTGYHTPLSISTVLESSLPFRVRVTINNQVSFVVST